MARTQTGDAGGLEDLEQSIELAEQSNSVYELVAAVNNLANQLSALGMLEEASVQRRHHREICERFGMTSLLSWNDAEAVADAYMRGDYPEMADRAERFLAREDASASYQEAVVRGVLAHGYISDGRIDAGLDQSGRALALARVAAEPQNVSGALLFRAHALTAAGRAAEATTLLDELLSLPDHLSFFQTLAPLPLLLAEQGRSRDFVAAIDTVSQRTPWRDAAVAVAAGRYADAAEAYARIGSRFVEAWCRLLAAEAGDPTELAEATAYFRSVGAAPYLRRCEALMAESA
jgi:tetratricopeptide (TPR) repeat protein